MNGKEKSLLIQILERLARIEERDKAFYETLKDLKKHSENVNEEVDALCKRVQSTENVYFEVKAFYDKSLMYWKAAAFIISPILTFGVITLVKFLLGMPIP